MPTPTYVPLGTVTLGSTPSSVTFSSIPATYRDLIIVINGGGSGNVRIGLNGDTTDGNFTGLYMDNSGTSTLNNTARRLLNFYGFMDSNLTTTYVVHLLDYSTTDKHKNYLSRSNNTANGVAALSGRWANTSAITSVALISEGTFIASTTFSIYGVIA